MSSINNQVIKNFPTIVTADANGNITGLTIGNISGNGTFTNIEVTGQSNLGPVGNVHITGGSNGQFLQTNGNGNLSWADASNGVSFTGNGTIVINYVDTGYVALPGSGAFVVNALVPLFGGTIQIGSTIRVAGVNYQVTFISQNLPTAGQTLINTTPPPSTSPGGIIYRVEPGNTIANVKQVTIGNGLAVVGNVGTPNAVTLTANVTGPAGSNTQVQYNANGAFGAEANFTYDYATNLLNVEKISTDSVSSNVISTLNIIVGNINASSNANITIGNATTGNILVGGINAKRIELTSATLETVSQNANISANILNMSGVLNMSGSLTKISSNTTEINGNVDMTISPNISLNSIDKVHIPGGANGQFLRTDGAGNLSFTSNLASGGTGAIQISNAGVLSNDANLTWEAANSNLSVIGGYLQYYYNGNNATHTAYGAYNSRGTKTSPLPLQAGDDLLRINTGAYTGNGTTVLPDGLGWTDHSVIVANVLTPPTSSGYRPSFDLYLQTVDTSNVTQQFIFDHTGILTANGVSITDVQNIAIGGAGNTGQFLQKNGTDVQWANVATPAGNAGDIQFSNGGALGASPTLNFNTASNTLGTINIFASGNVDLTGNLGANNANIVGSLTADTVKATNIGATSVFQNITANVAAGPGTLVTLDFGPATPISYNNAALQLTESNGVFTYAGTGVATYQVSYNMNYSGSANSGQSGFGIRVTKVSTSYDTAFSYNIKNPDNTISILSASATLTLTPTESFQIICVNSGAELSLLTSSYSSTLTVTRIN